MRKHLGNIIKAAVTIVALWFVFTQIDFQDVSNRILAVDWPWLLLAFLLVNGSLVLRAWRWQVLLRGLGKEVAFGRLVSLYFVGNFFNAFLPSGLGGDVVRAVEVAGDVSAGPAAGTVVVDRATGLLSLFILALAALPFRPASFPADLLWQITAVCIAGIIGLSVMIEGSLVRALAKRIPGFLRPIWNKLENMILAVGACGWRAFVQALGISFLFNLMQIGWWAATAVSLGKAINLSYFFLVTPIMSIAILMPSIGGLGVRETIAPTLFAGAGLSPAAAVSLSLLVYLMQRLSGLLGAPIYLVQLLRKRN